MSCYRQLEHSDVVAHVLSALPPAFGPWVLLRAVLVEAGMVICENVIEGQPWPLHPSMDHPVVLQVDVRTASVLANIITQLLSHDEELAGSEAH